MTNLKTQSGTIIEDPISIPNVPVSATAEQILIAIQLAGYVAPLHLVGSQALIAVGDADEYDGLSPGGLKIGRCVMHSVFL